MSALLKRKNWNFKNYEDDNHSDVYRLSLAYKFYYIDRRSILFVKWRKHLEKEIIPSDSVNRFGSFSLSSTHNPTKPCFRRTCVSSAISVPNSSPHLTSIEVKRWMDHESLTNIFKMRIFSRFYSPPPLIPIFNCFFLLLKTAPGRKTVYIVKTSISYYVTLFNLIFQ